MPKGDLYRDQNTGATRRITGRAPGYPWARINAKAKADDQVDDQAPDDTTPAPADDAQDDTTETKAPAEGATRTKGRRTK